MATINVDNSIPVDFLMVPCGEFSAAFSSAFNVCKPMDGTFNIESLLDITSDGVLNIETLSRIGVDKSLAIDIIQGISQFDRTISIEFIQDLSVDSIIPLNFLGEGVPIEVRSWILSSRENVYILNSREDGWVLLDRNDVLKLLSR